MTRNISFSDIIACSLGGIYQQLGDNSASEREVHVYPIMCHMLRVLFTFTTSRISNITSIQLPINKATLTSTHFLPERKVLVQRGSASFTYVLMQMSVKCQSSTAFFPFANIFVARLLQNTNIEHTAIPLQTSSLLPFTFNCTSFNNAVSSSHCIASYGGMMSE